MSIRNHHFPVFRNNQRVKSAKEYIVAAHKTHLTYDDVVATLPHLAPEEQLNLLEALSSVLKMRIAPGKVKKHSLLELEGLGEGIWSKVDVYEYIRQERDSWH